MDEQACDYLEGCPIFKYFRRSAKKVYIDMYCEGNYERCQRFLLRTEGEEVPTNLLPHGGTLWDENHARG